jgi:hypothetical protein
MNTNQLPAVLNEYSEYAPMVDLNGACINCTASGTTCAKTHPTAAQWLALRKLVLAA